MADLLENPYKGNRQYYFNLEEVNNVKYVCAGLIKTRSLSWTSGVVLWPSSTSTWGRLPARRRGRSCGGRSGSWSSLRRSTKCQTQPLILQIQIPSTGSSITKSQSSIALKSVPNRYFHISSTNIYSNNTVVGLQTHTTCIILKEVLEVFLKIYN